MLSMVALIYSHHLSGVSEELPSGGAGLAFAFAFGVLLGGSWVAKYMWQHGCTTCSIFGCFGFGWFTGSSQMPRFKYWFDWPYRSTERCKGCFGCPNGLKTIFFIPTVLRKVNSTVIHPFPILAFQAHTSILDTLVSLVQLGLEPFNETRSPELAKEVQILITFFVFFFFIFGSCNIKTSSI